jgi:hypothetical protein
MPLLGSAAMLLSFDIAPEALEEHDRLSIPGFRRGTRWVALGGEPRYMVLYEVENLQVLTSETYLARLNNPTPWTTRMMPNYRGMRRGLCTVDGSFGFGQGGTAALIRFTSDEERASELNHWLLRVLLPSLPHLSGLGSAHLLRGAATASMTNEQRIRGADRNVDSAIIVTGYDAGAVAACAKNLIGAGFLPDHGAMELASANYSSNYSLASSEIDA